MTEAFDSDLRRTATDLAARSRVSVDSGIFGEVSKVQWDQLMRVGPADQEVEWGLYRKAGADMVGVGLVPEVIVARHMGARVLGIARNTNDRSSGAAIAPLIREIVKEL
jgi:purine nucleoside phosphorylase